MTTGITAVRGTAPSALPRRLAVVALVAITTFSVTRFVSFSPSTSSSSDVGRRPPARPQIATLEASAERDPENARTWQQLGVAYLARATETADPASYALSTRAFDRADALVPGQADDQRRPRRAAALVAPVRARP